MKLPIAFAGNLQPAEREPGQLFEQGNLRRYSGTKSVNRESALLLEHGVV